MTTFKSFVLNEGKSSRISNEEYWKPSIDYNKVEWKQFDQIKDTLVNGRPFCHYFNGKQSDINNGCLFAKIVEDSVEHAVELYRGYDMHGTLDMVSIIWSMAKNSYYRQNNSLPCIEQMCDEHLFDRASRRVYAKYYIQEENDDGDIVFNINGAAYTTPVIVNYLNTIPIDLLNKYAKKITREADIQPVVLRALPTICKQGFSAACKIIHAILKTDKYKILERAWTDVLLPEIEYDILHKDPTLAHKMLDIDPDLLKNIKKMDAKIGHNFAEEIEARIS